MGVEVRIRDLRKSFGGNPVLKGVDIDFLPGRVHALLGPNGAGKSTLLGCISGAVLPDGGEVQIGETKYAGFSPAEAFNAGTAIIYQHFQLVGALSVTDNIFLGHELCDGIGRIRRTEQQRVARSLLAELGSDIDVSQPVDQLSVGQQQIVEIARALQQKPSLLVLDEPTAALSNHEVDSLLALVRRLAEERGLAIVYVTHLLREVLRVSDEVTVLRDGKVLWNRVTSSLEMHDLVEAISPSAVSTRRDTDRPPLGEKILELQQLDCGFTKEVSLELHGGEIVGVFGLLGSGRTDLLETVYGLRPVLAGEMQLFAEASATRDRRQTLAYVPADRKTQALFGEMSAEENLLMPHYSFLSGPMRNPRHEREIFDEIAARVALHPPNPKRPAEQFSGGNAQKISVGRWLVDQERLRLLIIDEPTQGVDVGSRVELYELLRDFVSDRRRAVLFATSDPDEVVAVADRVLVLSHGRPVGIYSSSIGETRLLSLAHEGESEIEPRANLSATQ